MITSFVEDPNNETLPLVLSNSDKAYFVKKSTVLDQIQNQEILESEEFNVIEEIDKIIKEELDETAEFWKTKSKKYENKKVRAMKKWKFNSSKKIQRVITVKY